MSGIRTVRLDSISLDIFFSCFPINHLCYRKRCLVRFTNFPQNHIQSIENVQLKLDSTELVHIVFYERKTMNSCNWYCFFIALFCGQWPLHPSPIAQKCVRLLFDLNLISINVKEMMSCQTIGTFQHKDVLLVCAHNGFTLH